MTDIPDFWLAFDKCQAEVQAELRRAASMPHVVSLRVDITPEQRAHAAHAQLSAALDTLFDLSLSHPQLVDDRALSCDGHVLNNLITTARRKRRAFG
jgi:hypothetical protein